jgi:hypothetical protein
MQFGEPLNELVPHSYFSRRFNRGNDITNGLEGCL